MKILVLSCANFVKFLPCPACKFTLSIIATFSTQLRGWVVGSKSTNMYDFACPWVRIPVQTENMSVIFFCADFFSFSYLKSASDSFRGVHKQYGPGRERGRQFYPIYLVTWFIVHGKLDWFLKFLPLVILNALWTNVQNHNFSTFKNIYLQRL